MRQHEIDDGTRAGITGAENERIKALEREVKELRRANEIIEVSQCFFCPGGARPRSEEINAYIDRHRDQYGVEPICKVLQVAPSAYWRYTARCCNPELRSQRAKRDEQLMLLIHRIWEQNFRVYGARKIWKQMHWKDLAVALYG